MRKDLIELPSKGRALIASDLHGNLTDYLKIIDLWKKTSSKKQHLIFTGDLINAMDKEDDGSIEILESVMDEMKNNQNFHPLLGNHEWANIVQVPVYKAGKNQINSFENLIKKKFREEWEEKLTQYIELFKKFPISIKTSNGVFISHAGPPKHIESLEEIEKITRKGYLPNQPLYEILWNRYGDYTQKDVENFLHAIGCKVMIVGHTPVDGVLKYGKQIIISSSFSLGKKAYVLLDLEKEISRTSDVMKMVRYLN
ncbi:MAG: serine/threonine protein phosphatase [Methanobacteriaceae archaeon]|nr:serine/threonine protein phosphatase [Methanobacteriaceae archaeon]